MLRVSIGKLEIISLFSILLALLVEPHLSVELALFWKFGFVVRLEHHVVENK